NRYDRIVSPRHDQRRLWKRSQPRQTAPAKSSEELQVIAIIARPTDMAQMMPRKFGRAAQRAAVNVSGDALHIIRILVAPRCCHLEQHGELAWDHEVAWRVGAQHKPPAISAFLKCELLRECAAPGYAQHVNSFIFQLFKELRREPCDRRRPIRQPRRRRASNAWHIKNNRPRTVECVKKRFD